MTTTHEYRVTFEIDCDGDTPEDAARTALDLLSNMPPPIHAVVRLMDPGFLPLIDRQPTPVTIGDETLL